MASCHYCSGDNGHLQHVLFLTQLPPLSPSHVSMADSSSVTLTEWSGDLRSTAGTSIDDVVVVDSSEEKVDPMQWLMQALPMKQMKEQVSSLFFHHCVTGDKQQQGMRPVIVLHFLLLLLVIISLCWLICVFFSLGMATVLFLMFNHVTNCKIFGKHFNYGMGIPVIIMCIEEENHWFSILKHSQQSFWDIFCWSQTCDWKRPLSHCLHLLHAGVKLWLK